MSLILDGTNGLSDVDGTAAAPAIRGTDGNTGIFFGTDIIGFSEGGVEAMRLNASGNLQTIGTISVGNATPSTSGAGITFPATQSASSDANTLDDYEEGTFSPVITPAAGAFGSVVYNASNAAYYTKIGRLVSATGLVWVTSYTTGTASNLMRISLPFSAANVTQNFAGGVAVQFGGNGYTPSILTANVTPRVEQGNAFFTLSVDNNVAYSDELIGAFSTAGFLFRFNVTYFV